ncbi:MAG: glucosamine-6-phosphate deaminase [Sphaerochaetaceae bacterium]|jgi:glucosamine-6-phosphate deaminase|nr:glucosamine-6-phosphate deaminase [Sphaerochaetaceae bacterium]MDY0372030.1 glucosamine-6-phosphate deaminase [Sphaerochaetaceae bacterium]
MRLIIQPDYEKLSCWAARYIAKKIIEFAPTANRPFVLGLPTGSSPLGTYQQLIEMYRRGELSFKHVVTFNMDEYIGLPEDHPQSYHAFMWDNLFSHVDIPRSQVNIPNGNAKDIDAECANYEQKIASAGGIKLFLGGIGSDGHIAFNEPYSSLASTTRVKSLTHDTKVMNSRFFGNDISKVPSTAITVGIKTIMDSEEVLLLVNGYGKARALKAAVEGPVSHAWTCSALQMHKKAIIVCDEPATDELKVGTWKYFKDIEAEHLNPDCLLVIGADSP